APARAALGADRDVRDALPAVEHRGSVGPAVPSDGRAHRVHHRGPPGGARGRGRNRASRPAARSRGVARADDHVHAAVPAKSPGRPPPGDRGVHRLALRLRPAGVRRRFEEVLKRAGIRESAYVDDVRRELTSRRIRGLVTSGVKVTPAEVEHALVLRREEVRAAWALVELGPLFAAATASDDELGKYLSAHPDEFRQPERRKVLSVTLAWKDFLKPVADDAVERYYREHATEFEEPRRARASHVLVRVPEAGGSEGEDKARAKVADVIRRAKAG